MRRRPSAGAVGLALGALALFISLGGTGLAGHVVRVTFADRARNADKVDGLHASRRPRAGRLLALDRSGHFPRSVFPAGLRGRAGPRGATGPRGPVGTLGPRGPIGPRGLAGAPGPTGQLGAPGARGATGPGGSTGQQGPTGPAGLDAPLNGIAAGGDLTGTYPAPAIAAGAVDSSKIRNGAITLADLNSSLVDAGATTPSLRTLGTGSRQAVAGDDPRLSDARPPTGPAGGDLGGSYPSPTIAPGAVTADKLGGNARLWGFAASDGTLLNGHGVVSIGVVRTGVYAVQFAQNVSLCGYLALPVGDLVTTPAGQIAAAPGGFAPAVVVVFTWGFDGNPAPSGFYVSVVC